MKFNKNNFFNPKSNTEMILHGNLLNAILMIAIPVVINSFLQSLYNLTDTYWLGRIGTEELASINLITPMQNIIINLGTGITVAGSVLTAQYIGARQEAKARLMATHIFLCALIFSIFCSVTCFIFTPNIVKWLGATGNIARFASIYLRIVVMDMPFLFTINIYTAIEQSQGDTVRPMLLNLAGILINMVLDPLLMVYLHLGVSGAALATLTAKIPLAVFAYISLFNKNNYIYTSYKGFVFDPNMLRDIIRVGLPTAIGGSTMQLGFLLMTKNVLVYGTDAMAAYGIGNKINGLITLPSTGMGSAVSTIVAQNIGAKQLDRAEASYKLSRNMSMAFLFIGGMILSRPFASGSIVRIFTQDPDVAAMAADFLSIMAFWCFTNGCHDATSALFKGNGHTEITMVMDISRLWIFRFASLYILGNILGMGVRSVWYCVVISNGLDSSIYYILYRLGFWRKNKLSIK